MVLLVVDTQNLIMSEELYNFYKFKDNVKSLLAAAREHGVEVIFVRHNDGEDGELVKGTDGFEIYEDFSPLPGEMIFDKIENIMLQFWNDYQDREISDDKIISLNIMTIFGQYTPTYEGKSYLENQKLFLDIAPFFNAKDRDDSTDIDYLLNLFVVSVKV